MKKRITEEKHVTDIVVTKEMKEFMRHGAMEALIESHGWKDKVEEMRKAGLKVDYEFVRTNFISDDHKVVLYGYVEVEV